MNYLRMKYNTSLKREAKRSHFSVLVFVLFTLFLLFKMNTVIADTSAPSPDVLSHVMKALTNHLSGVTPLTEQQLDEQRALFQDNASALTTSVVLISSAFKLVDQYDAAKGAIFISANTKKGILRTVTTPDGLALTRAIFTVQQGIFDFVYTPTSIDARHNFLRGKSFKTSVYFPGAAEPPVNPKISYQVPINATLTSPWGKPFSHSTDPVRRPTGLYVAPGSIAHVIVPASMVNAGFSILVGAHTWDKSVKPNLTRFDRVTNLFPITTMSTRVANPFGGGIYIIVPTLANLGVVTIKVDNVIKAPFFSMTSTHMMTNDEWQAVRANPAPWADFETDKFMMNVPRSYVYAFNDAVGLMMNWDKGMDGESEFYGYPTNRERTVLFMGVDVSIAHSVYGIGYPTVNHVYDPKKVYNGNKMDEMMAGPLTWPTDFHELSHAQLGSQYPGETEAIVNFPSVFTGVTQFGMDPEAIFASFGYAPNMTKNQAAQAWMVTPNFRSNNPMDTSNSTKNEVRYQARGYAKYLDISYLYGWDTLPKLYAQEQADYVAKTPKDGLKPADSRTFRLSKICGEDITPLIHFWGIHPIDPVALKAAIAKAGLPKSSRIYNLILHYGNIAPRNNADFRALHLALYPMLPTGGNPDYGYGWFNVWDSLFDDAAGSGIQDEIQTIISMYYN